ncbi:hypothetical protein D3C87_1891000 [compost metagenome]
MVDQIFLIVSHELLLAFLKQLQKTFRGEHIVTLGARLVTQRFKLSFVTRQQYAQIVEHPRLFRFQWF